MTPIAPFNSQHLEAACRVLADTERGLTGTQIERLLQEINVVDTSPGMTKWKRLFNALAAAQNKHHIGNHLVMLVNRAMNPVSYPRNVEAFSWRRDELNVCAEEFIVMDEKLIQAGYEVHLATPGGVAPTIDPKSLDPAVAGKEHVEHFQAYLRSNASRVAKPLSLSKVDAATYQAVIIPGGHGPVEDLYKDADVGRILTAANRAKKIIAPVCHGQAALLAAKDANGKWEFAGRKMTSFSDEEEIEFGYHASNAPWLLADTLRKNGAVYSQGPNWGPYVVTDGNLLSGQNPASTAPLADAVIAALR